MTSEGSTLCVTTKARVTRTTKHSGGSRISLFLRGCWTWRSWSPFCCRKVFFKVQRDNKSNSSSLGDKVPGRKTQVKPPYFYGNLKHLEFRWLTLRWMASSTSRPVTIRNYRGKANIIMFPLIFYRTKRGKEDEYGSKPKSIILPL